MTSFHKFRENVKLLIWDYIDIVHRVLRVMSVLVSVFTMGVIIYFYGFPQTIQSAYFCNIVIHCSLLFYAVKYLLSAFFSIHSKQYIREHWIEGFVLVFVLLWFAISMATGHNTFAYFMDNQPGWNFNDVAMVIVQIYFFVIMLTEISYIGDFLGKIRIGPGGLLIISFLILITIGTILLLLPEMTTHGISFIDALFTSASASCITGLSVLDIGGDFTFKGQFIIMLLVQLGGINVVCFASFLSYFYKGGTLRHQSVMKEMFNTTLQNSRNLTREIVIYTFIIELIGFVFLFSYFNITATYSHQWTDNAFLSAFHSIASFNNAGFCFLDGGMTNSVFRYSYYLQTITMILIFLGGIGFLTIHDVLYTAKGKKHFWKRLQITSKVVLKLSFIFIFLAAGAIFILEYNNTSAGMPLIDKIYTALFTSISNRTAGFNIIETETFRMSTRLIIIGLMLVGAAPGSTGGGIKLTTFYILFKSAIATILGKKQVVIYKRSVSYEIVDRAYVVLLFAIIIVFTGSFILSISDAQFSLENIVFEVASAFGTAGLSLGITPFLSTFGKIIIIIIMYIGRITVLTFALSVARRAFSRYSLAETNFGL
jgi:potassium uptake TrkH family protein